MNNMWNWKSIYSDKYKLITAIEILFFIIYGISVLTAKKTDYFFIGEDIILNMNGEQTEQNYIEEGEEGEFSFITPPVNLNKGIYQIVIRYRTDGENNKCDILSVSNGAYSIFYDDIVLSPYSTRSEFCIWANDQLESVQVRVNYGNIGSLEIDRIQVSRAWNSSLYLMFKFGILLAVLNGICFYFVNKKKINADRIVIVGLLGTVIIASSGLFMEYNVIGHDLDFHLLRIEGLKDGWLSGTFPVRIQPNWANGWGYPVSVMYGDLSLVFPAILRIIGMPVQDAYKWFVFLVNLGTAVCSYYCFKKISKNKYIGLICSIIYTLSVYRMCCIYIRAAVGEYTAMLFLPLIILCFYYAFMEPVENENYGRHIWEPVLGFTGLIQTHILTCQMAAIFIIILCMIAWRKVLQKKVFVYLVKIVSVTVLINLWFLVPFLQYMREDFNVFSLEFDGRIQRRGITFQELIAPIYNGIYGYRWDEILSLSDKFPISIGSTFLIGAVVLLLLLDGWKCLSLKKAAIVVLGMMSLSVFMATNMFPYNFINSFSSILGEVIGEVRLPYRYLSISGVLGTLVICFLLCEIRKRWSKNIVLVFTAALCLLAAFQASSYIYQVMFHRGVSYKYDEAALNTGNLVGDEYLYVGSNTWIPFQDNAAHGYHTDINGFWKKGNQVTVSAMATGEKPYVTIPLFYYVGYEAHDVNTNEKLEIFRSEDNNRIGISLSEEYGGTFRIQFKEPWYWRMAEIISLITILLLWYYPQKRIDITNED